MAKDREETLQDFTMWVLCVFLLGAIFSFETAFISPTHKGQGLLVRCWVFVKYSFLSQSVMLWFSAVGVLVARELAKRKRYRAEAKCEKQEEDNQKRLSLFGDDLSEQTKLMLDDEKVKRLVLEHGGLAEDSRDMCSGALLFVYFDQFKYRNNQAEVEALQNSLREQIPQIVEFSDVCEKEHGAFDDELSSRVLQETGFHWNDMVAPWVAIWLSSRLTCDHIADVELSSRLCALLRERVKGLTQELHSPGYYWRQLRMSESDS